MGATLRPEHPVGGTAHPGRATVEDARVDHRGGDMAVPEEFLMENRLAQVVPAPLTRFGVTVEPRGGEHLLPHSIAPSIGIFPGERGGKFDPARAALRIVLVLSPDGLKMPAAAPISAGRRLPWKKM